MQVKFSALRAGDKFRLVGHGTCLKVNPVNRFLNLETHEVVEKANMAEVVELLPNDVKSTTNPAEVQYPWRTRICWNVRGYSYFVDVCESECLDVARALWLTGAETMTLYIRGNSVRSVAWNFHPELTRGEQTGGYSGKE